MNSKVGAHIQRRDESYMLGQHLAGHVVKVIDFPDRSVERNPWPDKLVVIREPLEQSFEEWCIYNGANGAALWWDRVGKKYLSAPYATAVEILNEPWCGSDERTKQVAAFTREAIRVCHDNGLKCVALNMAEGNPPADNEQQWTDRVRVLLDAVVDADYLGLHGYWIPTSTGHSESGITKYHALPHVRWLGVADAYGIPASPVILTEAGCDGGVGYYKPRAGWRSLYGDFAAYLKDIAAFDAELLKEPRVHGAALFTAGATGMWQDFELGQDELSALNVYIEMQGGPWVPGVVPPPPPIDPVQPPNDKVMVLLTQAQANIAAAMALLADE